MLRMMYEENSRWAEALIAFQKVILGYPTLLEPQHPETLDAAEHLEMVHQMEFVSLD